MVWYAYNIFFKNILEFLLDLIFYWSNIFLELGEGVQNLFIYLFVKLVCVILSMEAFQVNSYIWDLVDKF